MEKKRSPVITGWRRVLPPFWRGKLAPHAAAAPSELAKERWEDDGGHPANAAPPKPPVL